jgi:ferredoxin-NADP reductase
LLYSSRTPKDVFYGAELQRRNRDDHGLDVIHLFTREVPQGGPASDTGTVAQGLGQAHGRPPGRLSAADIAAWGWPPDFEPDVFVCGPTGFVEAAADLLVDAGHEPGRVKTERFGPTGG